MNGSYCVYKHITPSQKVYIGITSINPLKRWANGCGYTHNEYFHRAICKYGWDNVQHEILCDGLSKEEAEVMEIKLIAEYESNNPKYGYNIQNGGNLAGKNTEATRRKMSQSQKGRKTPEEVKRKQSDAHIVRQIVQMDDNGNILAIWNGVKTAAKALNIPFQNIHDCVHKKGYRKHAGGYAWRFLDEIHVR